MVAYHGTVIGNIDVLRPFANPDSNLKYPCVYLSVNKALASIYIWNRPFKWMTFEIREDGMPVYNESFANGLREFYSGVKGFIYTCDGPFQTDRNTKISPAVISKEPVPVLETDLVEDAYERILEYERDGLLIINRFETLSEAQRQKDQNMILQTIKNKNLLKGDHPMAAFVAEKFPDIWEEAGGETK